MMTRRPAVDVAADPFYPRLKTYLIGATGMVFYANKDEELARIVGLRLKALELTSCGRYLDLLGDPQRGRVEMDELVAELTIGETYFFRHQEQFDALGKVVLPDVIKRNRASRHLRIWSAGCSTGAEPYTVAIMLLRDFGAAVRDWTIDILATDINKRFLGFARHGRFAEWALRTTPDAMRKACFDARGKEWELKREYREMVTFQYHNLVENPFPSMIDNLYAFDVILCRNVTIYFDRETVQRIVRQFRETLVEGGWLLAGHSESDLDTFRQFRTVNLPGAVVYQKGVPAIVGLDNPPVTPVPASFVPIPAPAVEESLPLWSAPAPPPVEPEPSEPALMRPGEDDNELQQIRRLADLGQWWEAVGRCEALLDKGGNDPQIHLYYALVLEQMNKRPAAEQALRRAIFIDRGFVLAHYHLGLLLQARGDLDGAAKSFGNVRRILDKEPEGRLVDEADGITAGQLAELAGMHLEVIGQS